MDVSESWIANILALPRETLVRDLIAVINDCILRTPNFMQQTADRGQDLAVHHALHFLADIDGHEACSCLLRLLGMHPDAVDFWLDEIEAYIPQNARIIAGDLMACMEWLKLAGIHRRGKGMVTEAMEQAAKDDHSILPEIKAGLGEVLAFMIESPPQDNVLDSGYLFVLIGTLVELRASEHLPLIRAAYDKELVEIFQVGTYEEVEKDMLGPLDPPKKCLPMARQYEQYLNCEGGEECDEDFEGIENGFASSGFPFDPLARSESFSLPNLTPFDRDAGMAAPLAGRNDPCPCGSGKKHKKCCMP